MMAQLVVVYSIGIGIEFGRVDLATRKMKSTPMVCLGYGRSTLPLHDRNFDSALMNKVLEYVENESVSLKEIFRVLKP